MDENRQSNSKNVLILTVQCDRPYDEVKALLLADLEQQYFGYVLQTTHGNLTATSRITKIDRKHLRKILKRNGLRGDCKQIVPKLHRDIRKNSDVFKRCLNIYTLLEGRDMSAKTLATNCDRLTDGKNLYAETRDYLLRHNFVEATLREGDRRNIFESFHWVDENIPPEWKQTLTKNLAS